MVRTKQIPSSADKQPYGRKKFIILLTIFVLYGAYVMFHFGVRDGLAVTLLTWAFFVVATPVADAGFLIDFPVRAFLGFKMMWAELSVWGLAGLIIAYHLLFAPSLFGSAPILQLFHTILMNPWPLWSIIMVSALGTFLSIYIGDQLFTLVQQRRAHHRIKKLQMRHLVMESLALVVVIGLYFALLSLTGVEIS